MKQYKAAVVGYGGMGRWHVQGIHKTDRVAFKGTYDLNPERMKLALEDGLSVSYDSYEALLADKEIDIVVVATPTTSICPWCAKRWRRAKLYYAKSL